MKTYATFFIALSLLANLLANLVANPAIAGSPPFNYPPSAKLEYNVEVTYNILTLNGAADIDWHVDAQKHTYSIHGTTTSPVLGKVLEASSKGMLNSFGLAPAAYDESPFRKSPTTTRFDRNAKKIVFSESPATVLKDGVQDRSSVIWQLISMARAAPEKFTTNSSWTFFVAGARDAEPWTFIVKDANAKSDALGEKNVKTMHVVKTSGSGNRQINIWLAPSLNWYPVHLTFEDNDLKIDQVLTKITHPEK